MPCSTMLEELWAELEGADRALAFTSGMASLAVVRAECFDPYIWGSVFFILRDFENARMWNRHRSTILRECWTRRC